MSPVSKINQLCDFEQYTSLLCTLLKVVVRINEHIKLHTNTCKYTGKYECKDICVCVCAHVVTHTHTHTHTREPKHVEYSCKDFDLLYKYQTIVMELVNHSVREFIEKAHLETKGPFRSILNSRGECTS